MQIGTFIKTPAVQVVEVLGLAGLDFAVVDAEHGPFDRHAADLMMVAGRAAKLDLFVRTADRSSTSVLWALDIGAAGLVVPHIDTAQHAAELVQAARFGGGARGFSNSPRFGRYGASSIEEAMALGDRACILAQIESRQAVLEAEAIIATSGLDGVVVGRADLALSMGLTRPDAPEVMAATRQVLGLARRHSKPAVVVVGRAAEAGQFIDMGATHIIVGSDQSFLRASALTSLAEIRAHATREEDRPA